MNQEENKLFEIYEIVKNSPSVHENYGFLSGLAGEIFFLDQFEHFYPKSASVIQEKVSGLVESLESFSGSYSFCSGIAGVCYMLYIINARERFGIDIGDEVDSYLDQSLDILIRKNEFEFLYGAIGLGQYYLVSENKSQLNKLLDYLSDSKIKIDEGYAWTTLDENRNRNINLGLSHGIAAIMVFLSKLYNSGILKERSEIIYELITGSINYLLHQQQDISKYVSYFPYSCPLDSKEPIKSRLGWCYGDLSEGIALYIAGKATNNKAAIECAIKVFTNAAVNRKDLKDNLVEDAGLCHGTAGIATIFNRMWRETGIESYKVAYEYWIENTLKMAKPGNGLAGYSFRSYYNQIVSGTHLLEGISGIGLVLLYHIHHADPKWDSCLLIG